MYKKIRLSDNYIMMIRCFTDKNVLENKRTYEIRTKIVHNEDYDELFERCIGEIEGNYYASIRTEIRKGVTFELFRTNILERKIKRKIDKFIKKSKKLVREWEHRDEMLSKINVYLEDTNKK